MENIDGQAYIAIIFIIFEDSGKQTLTKNQK